MFHVKGANADVSQIRRDVDISRKDSMIEPDLELGLILGMGERCCGKTNPMCRTHGKIWPLKAKDVYFSIWGKWELKYTILLSYIEVLNSECFIVLFVYWFCTKMFISFAGTRWYSLVQRGMGQVKPTKEWRSCFTVSKWLFL